MEDEFFCVFEPVQEDAITNTFKITKIFKSYKSS